MRKDFLVMKESLIFAYHCHLEINLYIPKLREGLFVLMQYPEFHLVTTVKYDVVGHDLLAGSQYRYLTKMSC